MRNLFLAVASGGLHGLLETEESTRRSKLRYKMKINHVFRCGDAEYERQVRTKTQRTPYSTDKFTKKELPRGREEKIKGHIQGRHGFTENIGNNTQREDRTKREQVFLLSKRQHFIGVPRLESIQISSLVWSLSPQGWHA